MENPEQNKPSKRRSRWRRFTVVMVDLGAISFALSQILALMRDLSTFV